MNVILAIDACACNPCQYNANCSTVNYQPFCKCEPGYTGKYCQTGIYLFLLRKIPRNFIAKELLLYF